MARKLTNKHQGCGRLMLSVEDVWTRSQWVPMHILEQPMIIISQHTEKHLSLDTQICYSLIVHPCEKVIRMFCQNKIGCIKRYNEVEKCQIFKRGYQQGPSDETLKKARCQFCDDKFSHRVMVAVGFVHYDIRNFTQITFSFTKRWSKGVVSWFSDIMLHKWFFVNYILLDKWK